MYRTSEILAAQDSKCWKPLPHDSWIGIHIILPSKEFEPVKWSLWLVNPISSSICCSVSRPVTFIQSKYSRNLKKYIMEGCCSYAVCTVRYDACKLFIPEKQDSFQLLKDILLVFSTVGFRSIQVIQGNFFNLPSFKLPLPSTQDSFGQHYKVVWHWDIRPGSFA